MKQYIGSIKVGDLLHTIGGTDTVIFEDVFIHGDDIINEPGISGELLLQTLNSTSIQITIISLQCSVKDISDISGNEYNRDVFIKDYVFVCTLPIDKGNIDDIYHSYEDVYEIDPHNFSINMETCIINAIHSQEPIVKIKNDESLGEGGIEVVDLPPL